MINSLYAIRDSALGLMVGTGSIIWIAYVSRKMLQKGGNGIR